MGDLRKLQDELKQIKAEIDVQIMPRARELQNMYTEEVVKPLILASSRIDNAVARTIMPVIEEIDAEGTGVTGRSRRTRIEQPEEEGTTKKTAPKKPEKMKLPPGKRGCGNCGRPGHRRTTCPN